jgi:hypothetical protein
VNTGLHCPNQLTALLYGAATCHHGGVSVDSFSNDIIRPFISSGSLMTYLDNAGKAATSREYGGDLEATLDVWNDAVRQTMTDVEAIGIETDLLAPIKSLLDRSSADGFGDNDIAAVVEKLLQK